MADTNDFGDVKESIDYIAEALDSLRAQNAMNAGGFEKVLTNINTKLEEISNEENSDLIKVFLAELKRSLEERHNFVSSKFTEIEDSFEKLVQKAEKQVEASEIKEVFDIIATNLNAFAGDFSQQKELISQLGAQIDEFRQDDSPKKDVLRNISVLKMELEKFSNGFESIILNLNDKFKELSQFLVTLDSSEALDGIKKDIENIFLSSNAVLSTLQVIDRKNRELEEIITHVVTKDDFNLEREQVAKLIEQNIEITKYINTLPSHKNLEDLTEKVDTAVGVINALKNMLGETGKQNQELLTAQLDNLEAKILNISTEEEFIGFRKELQDFSAEIIQSTNLMRADISDTNTELKDLAKFLSAMDIKTTFETFANLTKVSETNVKQSISTLSEKVSDDIDKNRKLTQVDIDDSVKRINEKIESAKSDLTESSKTNHSSILEHIQSVINNIFSVKNAIQIESAEQADHLESKIESLKENLAEASNYLHQTSVQNLENIVSNVEKVYQEISAVKENFEETSTQESKDISSGFSQISQKISEIKDEINQNSQDSFSNLLSIVDDFSQAIGEVKTSVESISNENVENIKEVITELSEKLPSIKEELINRAEYNKGEIKGSIDDLSQFTKSLKASIEQSSSVGFSGIKNNFEDLVQRLETLEENYDLKSQTNLNKIVSLFGNLTEEFNTHKEFLSESAQVNFETVSIYIQNLNKRIEEAKTEFGEDVKANFEELQSAISSIPETIKENQSVFENEKRTLIEQNSRNIQEMNENVQNLIKGLVAKENPFKGEVLFEFAELKTNLEKIKEAMLQSNEELGETIDEQTGRNIQDIENAISTHGEKYAIAIANLQNNISQYFEQLEQSSQENDIKIETSLREASEIKSEIQNVSSRILELQNDSTLFEISSDLNKKIDGILLNITQLEGIFSNKNRESLQSVLSEMEQKFESVCENLENYRELSSCERLEFIEDLKDKFEFFRDQINLTCTDFQNIVATKTDAVLKGLNPIKEALDSICQVDFHALIQEVKEKIDNTYLSLRATIKEDLKSENQIQFEKLTGDFELLNEKIDNISVKVSEDSSDEFEEIKMLIDGLSNTIEASSTAIRNRLEDSELFTDQFSSLESAIFEAKNQNTNAINDALKKVLGKLEELDLSTASAQNTVREVETNFEEKLNVTQDVIIQAQEDAKEVIVSEVTKSANIVKSALIQEFDDKTFSMKEDFGTIAKAAVTDIIERTTEASREKAFERFEALEDEFAQKQEDIKALIVDEILEAKDSSDKALLNEIAKKQNETAASIIENIIDAQNDGSSSLSEELSQKHETLKNDISEIIVEAQTNSNKCLIDELAQKQDSIKSEIVDEILGSQENVKSSLLEEFSRQQESSKTEFVAELLESQDSTKSAILLGLGQAQNVAKSELLEEFDQKQHEIKIELITEITENIEAVKEDFATTKDMVAQTIEKTTEESREKVFEKLDAFEDKLSEISQNTSTEILDEIGRAHEETENAILAELQENIKLVKEIILAVAPEAVPAELKAKFDKLNESVDTVSQTIIEKIEGVEENQKSSTQSLLSEVKTNFWEKVDDTFDELKSFFEVLDSQKDFTKDIDDLKTDVFDKLGEITDGLEDSISSISVKDELQELGKDIKQNIGEMFDNIEEKLTSSIENSSTITDISNKTEEASKRIEELKKVITDEISEKIAGFEINAQSQKNDFEQITTDLKASIDELKESYIDLSINSTMEISNVLVTVQEKINEIENNLSKLDSLETIQESISQVKDSICEDLSKEFEIINQKLDAICEEPDSEIGKSIDEIKQIVQSQSEFIEKLDNLESLDKLDSLEKLSKLDGLENVKSEIQAALKKLETNLEGSSQKVSAEIDTQEIKNELNSFKEELLENLISIFSQVSFVEESEDIKDFIEEKADEIKSTISSKMNFDFNTDGIDSGELKNALKASLGSNFNNILTSLDSLHEKTVNVDFNCHELANDIKEVKSKLLLDDSPEYSYTLQDVESDIAKIRLILKEMSGSKTDGGFESLGDIEKLNENIISISSRTNKLLLNSDESYNVLKENLEDFKNIIYQLEERIRHVDSSEALSAMSKKLDSVNKLAVSCVNSDKTFNQAFMFLAEWIDKADEKISSIAEKMSETDEIKLSINDLKKTMPKRTDIELVLDEISEKFNQQQEKINSLEEKIERMGSFDVKSIVTEVLSQVGSEPTVDLKLNKKVDNIDKQLAKLSKSIEKITSYVDEE